MSSFYRARGPLVDLSDRVDLGINGVVPLVEQVDGMVAVPVYEP